MASISSCEIYLSLYNNYANREAKDLTYRITEDTFTNVLIGYSDFMSGVDFNPGDGVSTTLVCNRHNDEAVDYVFVFSGEYGSAVSSRWFILKSDRLRNGQYRLTLRRDLVADFYSYYRYSPIYVQKATLSDDDPLIFNDEGIRFNQIKQSQTPLMDATRCGWIVGYCQAGIDSFAVSKPLNDKPVYAYDKITDCPAYGYVGVSTKFITSFGVRLMVPELITTSGVRITDLSAFSSGDHSEIYGYAYDVSPSTTEIYGIPVSKYKLQITCPKYPDAIVGNLRAYTSQMLANLETVRSAIEPSMMSDLGASSEATYRAIQKYFDVPILEMSTGTIYYLSSKGAETGTEYGGGSYDSNDSVSSFLRKCSDATSSQSMRVAYSGPDVDLPVYVEGVAQTMTVALTATTQGISSSTATLTWPAGTIPAQDAPYVAFCMPCPVDGTTPSVIVSGWDLASDSSVSSDVVKCVASGLATSMGSHLYDLQYLPYCPIPSLRAGLEYDPDSSDVIWVRFKDENLFPILLCDETSFELSIPKSIAVADKKVSHCCDKYRLMSPNFANYDEFDPAMNGGVSSFHVQCTYRPYSPYICVHINYGGMYGADFDDNRGLILGGDYSLPIMSDAWVEYQLNNKNYSNIFDRQLAYGEDMQNYARVSSAFNAVGSTVQGAITGAMAGGVAGAVAGGVMGAAGGVADAITAETKYQAGKQYQIDMYNYSLDNIQAKPDTLVKASSINVNQTTWPVIEHFTCTDEEKDMLRDKLKYNGMTVMRIGTIDEFASKITRSLSKGSYVGATYFQGQLIHCDGFPGDANMYAALSDELAQGIYIVDDSHQRATVILR